MEVVNDDEIDPLDAYMQEIDQQVQMLDEKDKLKARETQAEAAKIQQNSMESVKTDSTAAAASIIESEEEGDDETIGKAGNFATVEELIAYHYWLNSHLIF